MNVKLSVLAAIPLGLGVAVAVAQGPERSEPARAQPAASEIALDKTPKQARDTFWPPNWMVNAWLKRSIRDMGRRHNFSDEQNQKLFELYAERLPRFMAKNRENLEPVLTGVTKALVGREAPPVEHMVDLANAAKPLVNEVQELVHGVFDDFKEELDPTQLVRMQREMSGMDFAMKMTARKLEDWSRGIYDPKTSLPGLDAPSVDPGNLGRRRPPPGTKAPGRSSPDPATPRRQPVEKDRFDIYVETFIAKYDLYPGQKKTAYAILVEIKERAEPEKDKARQKLAAIEQQQKDLAEKAKGLTTEQLEVARAKLEKNKARATGRLDTLFGELQKRLSLLLQKRQRRIAEA